MMAGSGPYWKRDEFDELLPIITAEHGAVTRDPNRLLALAIVSVVVLALIAFVLTSSSNDASNAGTTRKSALPGIPGTSNGTLRRYSTVPASAGTSLDATTTSIRPHHTSLTQAGSPCKVYGPDAKVEGLPNLHDQFTSPVSQPEALIPGSMSLAQWQGPDFGIEPIANSDYVVLGSGGGPDGDIDVVGHLDPRTGKFEQAIALRGCAIFNMPKLISEQSPGGHVHLWALGWAQPPGSSSADRFLADLDLTVGLVSWSGHCETCDRLEDGGDEVWVFGDTIGAQGTLRLPSGVWEFVAIRRDDHRVRQPVQVVLGDYAVDRGRLFEGTRNVGPSEHGLVRLNPLTGVVDKEWRIGSGEPTLNLMQPIYQAGNRLWIREDAAYVARDADNFAVLQRVMIPECSGAWIAGDRIWYEGTYCDTVPATAPSRDEELLGWIDPVTGESRVVAQFFTYLDLVPGAGFNPHDSKIANDATGFWYAEQIPTPSGPPDTDATSDGPVYLFHVDA